MSFINNTAALVQDVAATAIYTCPADLAITLSTINVYAPGGAGTLALSLYRQSTGATVTLLSARAVAVDDPYTHPKPIMLSAGDVLYAAAAGADLAVDVGGVVQGASGGSATLTPRGAYDVGATYHRLHIAESGGSSYVALADNLTGDAPPSANWMILAGKGNPGNDGADGLDGDDGSDGVDGVPQSTVDRLAVTGIAPTNEMIVIGDRLILTHDTYVQSDFDLTGKTIETPFGSTLCVTQADPATRRALPLITQDETVDDLLVIGTLHVLSDTTLTVTGILEIQPV